MDSDDESEPDDGLAPTAGVGDDDDEESEEDRPTVVGDIEVDMEAEEEEFLRFSREALGITEDEWNDILNDRTKRGGKLMHVYDVYALTKYLVVSSIRANIFPVTSCWSWGKIDVLLCSQPILTNLSSRCTSTLLYLKCPNLHRSTQQSQKLRGVAPTPTLIRLKP